MLPFLAGLGAVAAARLLTLPRTVWEWDEVLFVQGVGAFEPLRHHPHPPGYPLLIGLGKLFELVAGDPFRGLVALGVIASLVGYAALVDAFGRFAAAPGAAPEERRAADRAAILGAGLFHLSPAMLVYGPLALSDAPALAFLALALAAAARLGPAGERNTAPALALGAFASAAIGVRPQLAIAVLPMLAVALLAAPSRRRLLAGTAAFALVSLSWFVPLVVAVGGPEGLLPFLGGQAGNVLVYDMEQPRAGVSALAVATRFLAHPWGDKLTALPVLGLAAAGAAALVGRRRIAAALPLAALAGVDLALCLFVLNPDDAARYALPSMLAVAAAAGLGCVALAGAARRPVLAWGVGAALATGFVAFTWPLLAVRASTPSPPVQAARWLSSSQAPGTTLLVEPSLAAHAAALLPGFALHPVDQGVPAVALALGTPVWLLGDGESAIPGARTFRWPASDPYGKLTRRHYGVVSLSPLPGAQRFQALAGVHGPEPSLRQRSWRWLDAAAAVRVDGAGRALAVTLRLPANVPWPANTVTVGLAGARPQAVVLARGETRRIVLRSTGEAPVELSFHSRAAFVPARSGLGPDYRRLAVQLMGVEQTAAAAEPRSGDVAAPVTIEARRELPHASRRPT